jgi:UDP-N-acetylglucosamine 3-dehydrogenase
MGQHHARIVQDSPRVEFAGAVAIKHTGELDEDLVHRSVEDLLAASAFDFAVVALPTALHESASVALAEQGIHLLIEKPLALSLSEAATILRACTRRQVHGAVAHVERHNPAAVELKRLLAEGAIGRPVAIVTERAGPFPVRIRDIGVIADLATHDLDLIPWLVDDRIETVFAQTSQPSAAGHEHFAAITGRLGGGIFFNTVADWMSGVKTRRVRVIGEEGTLAADLLARSLVRVGSAITEIALSPTEPLAAQFDSFCDLLEGADDASVVSLADGLQAVACADAALRSARDRRVITV